MNFPIQKLKQIDTPFYYYDTAILRQTLNVINEEAGKYENYCVHYAIKANANPKLLRIIAAAGLGADCVSGGEVEAAVAAGFPASKIVFAGVAKADWEIELGLNLGISCFNVESLPELEVINELAGNLGTKANVAFRINPEVGAHTHHNIATGNAEDKFGIAMHDMITAIRTAEKMENIDFCGLHFHIGSQILEMDDFIALCGRVNELQDQLEAQGITCKSINVGGGLGIDYQQPDKNPIPNFKDFFKTYANGMKLRNGQTLHFELGRSVVAQCGSLITRTLYIKHGVVKQFLIVDAGFPDLIRPALYDAYHKIENIENYDSIEKADTIDSADSVDSVGSNDSVDLTDFIDTTDSIKKVNSAENANNLETYDVVGPICESTDVFGKDRKLPTTKRGDLIALRSAGAYGEVMASQYNCRPLPKGWLSEEL